MCIRDSYDTPPRCQINLETMETLAVERLRFLRIMEKHSSLSATRGSDEWRINIMADVKNQGLEAYANIRLKANTSEGDKGIILQNRARDHFSHFILRLAYCRTEDLRRWFISQELDAFRWRCMNASDGEVGIFMSEYDLRFLEVSEEEKKDLAKELLAVLQSQYQPKSEADGTFFIVHFTESL